MSLSELIEAVRAESGLDKATAIRDRFNIPPRKSLRKGAGKALVTKAMKLLKQEMLNVEMAIVAGELDDVDAQQVAEAMRKAHNLLRSSVQVIRGIE